MKGKTGHNWLTCKNTQVWLKNGSQSDLGWESMLYKVCAMRRTCGPRWCLFTCWTCCFSSCVTSMGMESSPRDFISSTVKYLYECSPIMFSSPEMITNHFCPLFSQQKAIKFSQFFFINKSFFSFFSRQKSRKIWSSVKRSRMRTLEFDASILFWT